MTVRAWCGALAGIVMLGAVQAPAQAHPHVWIDADYTFDLGPGQVLRTVDVEWRFDELYSQATARIIDMDLDQEVSPAELRELIDEAMKNLEEWSYYLDLRQRQGEREVRLKTGKATGGRATLEDGILVFRFTVPVFSPVSLDGASLTVRGYDPTLYIGVEPAEDRPVRFAPEQPGCRSFVGASPEPPSRSLLGGGMLVPDQQVPDDIEPGAEGIGFAFARVITLTCKAAG